jgi:hypothetical protein
MIEQNTSNSFTTKDWINSTKNTPIFAYNPAEVENTVNPATGTFTQSDFESALRKASRRVDSSEFDTKTK